MTVELHADVDRIFAALEGISPDMIRVLAAGRRLGDEPLSRFARAFDTYAGDIEAGDPPNPLARIRMRQALRHGAAAGLATKLVDARGDLWRRVFDGLATARAEGNQVSC